MPPKNKSQESILRQAIKQAAVTTGSSLVEISSSIQAQPSKRFQLLGIENYVAWDFGK